MAHMTIPKLAQELRLSDNTVRRYTKRYGQFFRREFIDGWEQYPVEETLKLVKRINEISQPGKRSSDVIAELEKEFSVVEVPEPEVEINAGEAGGPELGPKSLELLARIASALEKLAEGGGQGVVKGHM